MNYLAVPPETRQAIEALCVEYLWRIDNGHADRVPELFTDDAVWEGPNGAMRGRAELEAAWGARAKRPITTRHMLSSVRLTQEADGVVRGWAGFTLFMADNDARPAPVPVLVAEHVDTYWRGDDGVWRIATRRVSAAFYDETWPR